MFINCPNVLLQVGFVQSVLCCNVTLKNVFPVNVCRVKSGNCMNGLHIEFGKLRCGKETCINDKNSTRLLNFQSGFPNKLPSCPTLC